MFFISRPLQISIVLTHWNYNSHSILHLLHSFKFTKLDRNDPSRPFTFMLSTDENDQYMLSKVNPSISQTKTDAILDELNKDGTNGLNKFAIGMSEYHIECRPVANIILSMCLFIIFMTDRLILVIISFSLLIHRH